MVRLAKHRKASLKREDSSYEKLRRQSADKYVVKPLVEETSFNVTTTTVVELDQNDTSSTSSSGSS